MSGKKISQVEQASSASSVSNFKVPCATGDGTAKYLTVAQIMQHCSTVLGIDTIQEFSTTKQYVAGKVGDGYCIYNNKLYRFTSPHIGAWNASHVVETTLYNELLNFYSQTFEAVTVHISVADSGFSVSGLQVGVKLDDGTTTQYTTNAQGTVTFNVEKGMNYTISLSNKANYLTIKDKTYRSQNNTRDVYFVYNPTSSSANMEVVNVYPGTLNNDYTKFAGTLLTVKIGGTTNQYSFDSTNNRWQFSVPHGSDYTITMPSITNYLLFDFTTLTFSASLTERAIFGGTYYYIGGEGIFYTLNDGTDKAVSAYNAGNIGTIKDNIKFIHIATQSLLNAQSSRKASAKCDFYFSINYTTAVQKKWRATNTRFNSIQNISAQATAKLDFDGYNNTMAIKAELAGLGETQDNNYVLPYLASLETVTNHNSETLTPFILSLGQFCELITLFSTYQTAMKLIGKTPLTLKSSNWWCSTQYSDTNMWYISNGSPYFNGKSYLYYVLPAFAY